MKEANWLNERPTLSVKAKSISRFGCFHFIHKEIVCHLERREDKEKRCELWERQAHVGSDVRNPREG
jgi:hypothetical protein